MALVSPSLELFTHSQPSSSPSDQDAPRWEFIPFARTPKDSLLFSQAALSINVEDYIPDQSHWDEQPLEVITIMQSRLRKRAAARPLILASSLREAMRRMNISSGSDSEESVVSTSRPATPKSPRPLPSGASLSSPNASFMTPRET